jgi:hypothetical protein
MIYIYKAGDDYEKDGIKYKAKCVNLKDLESFLADGWVKDLSEIKPEKKKRKKREAKIVESVKQVEEVLEDGNSDDNNEG